MGLYIRMALYLVFGMLAGQGLVMFDETAGTITFQIDHVATALTGFAGYLATFGLSRFSKKRGGMT